MEMRRYFLPVGQGACYLEQFFCDSNNPINVIYDCGSLTDETLPIKCLDDILEERATISAVFISHFDSDHVNCLPKLLEKYHVKKLFIPLVKNEYKEYCLLDLLLYSKNLFDFFKPIIMDDSIRIADTETGIYRIGSNAEERSSDNIVSSGNDLAHLITGHLFEWRFIPFNFECVKRCEQFEKEYNKVFGALSITDLCDKLRRNEIEPKNIQEIYKKVKGTINSNSLVLYSGTANEVRGVRIIPQHCCECTRRFYVIRKSGCLYTGDYDASNTDAFYELRDRYDDYWDNIGCIQVPHHGSKGNWNSGFLDSEARDFVISCGTHNQYRHPSSFVLIDIMNGMRHSPGFPYRFPIVVTEERLSECVYEIDFDKKEHNI